MSAAAQSPTDDTIAGSGSAATAVVTGAASGLGAYIAHHLLNNGVTVACVDLDGGALETLYPHAGAVVLAADVTDADSMARLGEKLKTRLGTINTLIPCAGRAGPVSLAETDAQAWREVVDVNLNGVFITVTALLPLMRSANSAQVVFIGSISGHKPRSYLMAYRAAKAGVLMLMHCMAVHEGPDVRINAISPGPVITPMQTSIIEQHVAGGEQSAADYAAARTAVIPMRRFAEPTDITGVLDFLMSDAAAFITGQEIILDGGEYPVF